MKKIQRHLNTNRIHYNGMDISNATIRSAVFSHLSDFVRNIKNVKYGFTYGILTKSHQSTTNLSALGGSLSIVVTEGHLKIINGCPGKTDEITIQPGDGVHLGEGSCFKLHSISEEPTKVLIGSSTEAQLVEIPDNKKRIIFKAKPLSQYKIEKPWGWERIYTKDIEDGLKYSLKLIFIKEGKQIAVQPHHQKAETNFITKGKVNLLFGQNQSKDIDLPFDINLLLQKTYQQGFGWSNSLKELHRLEAISDTHCVAISTPESGDFILRQQYTNQTSGRILIEYKDAFGYNKKS